MKTSKNLFRNTCIALLFLVGLTTTSCENDFEINADWKETIIIYGLLDPLDSVQEIKINKAFLNSVGSAYEVAQNPDSLYLDSTFATITEVGSGRLIVLKKTLVSKRELNALLQDTKAVKKLIEVYVPRFANRTSGYTRVVKLGVRRGDGATVAQIEYLQ